MKLDASTTGTFSGPVVIASNDPAQPQFTFPVTGMVVANDLPVYAPLTVTTVEGKPVAISFEKLTKQVTDANGDAISITRFREISEKGAFISKGDGSLVFTQPVALAGTDTFEVTFSDGTAQLTGIVTVEVASDLVTFPKNAPKIQVLADGRVKLTFTGIPKRIYSIQQANNGVNFIQIGTATAASTGKVVFTTASAPPANADFRIRQF